MPTAHMMSIPTRMPPFVPRIVRYPIRTTPMMARITQIPSERKVPSAMLWGIE